MQSSWMHKLKNTAVTLPFSILSIFISLIVAITLLIILIQSYSFTKAIHFTASAMIQNASNEIQQMTIKLLRPAQIDTVLSSQLMQNNIISDETNELINYTYFLLQALPLVNGTFYGDTYGRQIYSSRKNGIIITDIQDRHVTPATRNIIIRNNNNIIQKAYSDTVNQDDPRTKPWFLVAKKLGHFTWSPIFQFAGENNILGIVSAAPVFKNGQFAGVFGVNISLNHLSTFLSQQKISPHGFAFIVTENEDLVAYPRENSFFKTDQNTNVISNVHQTNLPLINTSLDLYKKTKQENIRLSFNNEYYLINFQPIPDMKEYGWLVGVVIPENDLIGPLERTNILTIIISVLFLVLGIYLVSTLIAKIVKPIDLLSKEADKIKDFNLGEPLPLRSRIREVVSLTNSLNNMKIGLKHFQKYVPKILVRQLIQSGQDIRLGGEKKQLAILFSDIENFTTISETIDADELMLQLCEYFDYMSKIILRQQGTIDKYIGDAVMVFWGAPLPMPLEDACYQAAITALECQQQIQSLNTEWQKLGKPVFNTRIGIHAGEAIVGNVGSNERMNYTAVGDAINVASRLEQINKPYHTKIIVSATVHAYIRDQFEMKFIDHVEVKGRAKPIEIYELIRKL